MNWNKRDQELKEELEAHLRLAAQDRMERGENPAEAHADARRELGNAALVQEVTQEVWGWGSVRRFFQDARFGARMLRRNPVFAAVAILTLALGIGATTAIFSVVYGVLLRPLPYEKPDQIAQLSELNGKGDRISFSDANFIDFHNQNRSFQGLAEYQWGLDAITGTSEPRRVPVAYVSHDFFSIFGVGPVLGRAFVHEEEIPNGVPAALVSYSFWRENLNSQPDLSRLKLGLEGEYVSVIGVMPAGFNYPGDTQVWLSSDTSTKPTSRSAGGWKVVGRIRNGVTLREANAELSGIASRIHQQFGQDTSMTGALAVPLRSAMTANVRPALLILLEVSGLLLLVAGANVVNLLLAQASAREAELAVRSALGASNARLARQFLAESLPLCLTGGVAGVAFAYGGVRILLWLAPQNLPRLNDVSVNVPVLLFALGISLAVAAGLGLLTAFRATSIQGHAGISHTGRGGGSARTTRRLSHAIMAGQVAITLVLLVGAGLLGRSFLRVLSVDPGFRTEKIVTLDLSLPVAGESAKRITTVRQMIEGLRAIPGVIEAGGTSDLPLQGGNYSDGTFAIINEQQISAKAQELIRRSVNFKDSLTTADYKALDEFFTPLFADKAHTGDADYVVASAGYFQALSIPLRRGRWFTDADTMDAPHVALISETLARKVWPDRDPLGQTIEFGNMDGDLRLLTVIGVVGDVHGTNLEAPPTPIIYVNYSQRPPKSSEFSLVLRTASDPVSTLSTARSVINQVDPTIPVKTSTFTRVFAASLDSRRFNLLLVGFFSVTALLLAIAGIYGVLAYSVEKRTRELGVRIALGADSSSVVRLVLQQAALTTSIGLLVGAIVAFLMTRLMQSMVFGISTSDPVTYACVAGLLIVVALLAAYVPAHRATRIDPMIALRAE